MYSAKILALFILLSLIIAIPAYSEEVKNLPEFQIVESVPLETILDVPEIPNAPDVWVEMINSAKNTIDIETFYIFHEKGQPLEPVINAIKDAGKRGVKVRIISDSKFYKKYPETLDELDKEDNITVKIFAMEKLTGGVVHIKYFVIDKKELFMGSQNFDWKAMNQIHEIGVRVRNGEICSMFLKMFDIDWMIADGKDKKEYGKLLEEENPGAVNSKNPVKLTVNEKDKATVYPSFSPIGLLPKGFDWEEDEMLKLMKNARKEICVQVMTYSPFDKYDKTFYPVLDNAIRDAACRGVKVKLIFADWSTGKPNIDFIKSLSLIPNVEIKISTIPEYSKGKIDFARVEHCKYMVVDDTFTWIGTGNWEKGYFHTSRNASFIVDSSVINGQMKSIFMKDWTGPYTNFVDVMKEYKSNK